MAHEATLLYQLELPVPFTVAAGTAIEKGTLLKLTDGMVAIAHSGDEDAICGIAAEEKTATDGKTQLAVYIRGIFKMYTSAAVTVGDAVAASATANEVKTADASCVGAKIVGIAYETSGGDDESIIVLVNCGCVNNKAYA